MTDKEALEAEIAAHKETKERAERAERALVAAVNGKVAFSTGLETSNGILAHQAISQRDEAIAERDALRLELEALKASSALHTGK